MSASEVKIPGPDHPITIEPREGRVVIRAGERVVANTEAALELAEASYPVVLYVPFDDVDGHVLQRSDSTSYCPYKGNASYFTVRTDDDLLEDVAWCYEKPYDAVAEIRGHVAFYADRVMIES
ncbi:MAG TPA: DUF427 domain-containing protein [Solirubrobacteraceae bacterium]|nr:DUF427 domain-containing protein [Solirubrobacteraceae bacterium]